MDHRKNSSPKCCKIGIFIRNMLIYQEHMKLNSALVLAVVNAVISIIIYHQTTSNFLNILFTCIMCILYTYHI